MQPDTMFSFPSCYHSRFDGPGGSWKLLVEWEQLVSVCTPSDHYTQTGFALINTAGGPVIILRLTGMRIA